MQAHLLVMQHLSSFQLLFILLRSTLIGYVTLTVKQMQFMFMPNEDTTHNAANVVVVVGQVIARI